MEKISDEKILLVGKLSAEGLNYHAIQRVTGLDLRTIRKYCGMYDVTVPRCVCKPGMFILPCVCNTAKIEVEE